MSIFMATTAGLQQSDESDFDTEDVSATTYAILCALGIFLLGTLFRLTNRLWRGNNGRRGSKPLQSPKTERHSESTAEPSVPKSSSAQPQKPGVSLKKLVKSSQQASSRQVASDKPVDHPLYINSIRACHDGITGISFSESGSELAAACEDRVLRVFKIEDIQSKSTFSFKRKEMLRDIVDVAFGAGNDLFVSSRGGVDLAVLEKYEIASNSGKGNAFNLAWEAKNIHGKESAKGLRAAFNPHTSQKSLAISYSAQADLQLFDHNGTQLATINSAGLQNHDLAFSRSGRFFGAATFTTDVRLYEVQYTREGDFRRVAKVMDLKKAHNGQVLCVAFSPDGSQIVSSSKDGSWALWNIDVRYLQDEDPKMLMKSEQETEDGERYERLAFGPNHVVAAAFGTTLQFLDAKRGTVLEQIEDAHDKPITAMQWSPVPHKVGKSSSAILATASLDKRIRLWRAPFL